MTVKIVTGWSNPGGSTTAHINLCNAFNEVGIETILYGPHEYASKFCNFRHIKDLLINRKDKVISHFCSLGSFENRHIYSCHETNLHPSSIKPTHYDAIHVVSQFQKNWFLESGKFGKRNNLVVIPNIISEIVWSPIKTDKKIAGVIGSVDSHKRTHLSVERALADGCDEVHIFGGMSEPDYFTNKIYTLLDGLSKQKVFYQGQRDRSYIYSMINCVYHSSLRETFNYIQAECSNIGMEYHGLPENDPQAKYLSKEQIVSLWKNLLNL